MSTQSTSMTKRRGGTVQNPATTKYSLWTWIKGYAAWVLVFPLYVSLWAFARVFKRVPNWLLRKLLREHKREIESRQPDVRIPGDMSIPPYMLRWWRIKRNAFFNIYYHVVRRSDDDRALHCHPWWNFSIVLEGGYYEHLILNGGVHEKTFYPAGSVRFRPSGRFAHRLELERWPEDAMIGLRGREKAVHTIFITGPVLRRWGFHAGEDGWIDAYDWDSYLDSKGIETTMRMGDYAQQVKGPTT
jgi:hypothetical protein